MFNTLLTHYLGRMQLDELTAPVSGRRKGLGRGGLAPFLSWNGVKNERNLGNFNQHAA